MEITRYKNEENSYDYYLEKDDKELWISFGGNLDLYWTLKIKDNIKEYNYDEDIYREVKDTFTITKENYSIYSLFDELFNDIKECKIHKFEKNSYHEEKLFNSKETLEEKFTHWNNEQKKNPPYKNLYNRETITWYSDDEEISVADYVTIKKVDDTYQLSFTRPRITEDKYSLRRKNTVTIRFRNSGSRYDPLNVIFMRMYRNLQDYNPNYHQLHLEELSESKKLKLSK